MQPEPERSPNCQIYTYLPPCGPLIHAPQLLDQLVNHGRFTQCLESQRFTRNRSLWFADGLWLALDVVSFLKSHYNIPPIPHSPPVLPVLSFSFVFCRVHLPSPPGVSPIASSYSILSFTSLPLNCVLSRSLNPVFGIQTKVVREREKKKEKEKKLLISTPSLSSVPPCLISSHLDSDISISQKENSHKATGYKYKYKASATPYRLDLLVIK